MTLTRTQLAALIDHTLLKAGATLAQVETLGDEARLHGFASVCIHPMRVRHALLSLEGLVRICTVIGFPLGASLSAVKASEACLAVADGADELDVVINLGALKDGDHAAVLRDLATVVTIAEGRIVPTAPPEPGAFIGGRSSGGSSSLIVHCQARERRIQSLDRSLSGPSMADPDP